MQNSDSCSSAIPIPNHDWTRTIYRNVMKLVSIDVPPPLGADFVTTRHVDATLCHYFTKGHFVLLHLINQTVIYFFPK